MNQAHPETSRESAPGNTGARAALRVRDVSIVYWTENGPIPAVRNVSLSLAPQRTLGLVGESGSGKTTLALGTVGYLPDNGRMTAGSVRLGDTELSALPRKVIRRVWGSRVTFVSQNPSAALNPSLTIGRQLDEMGRNHLGLNRRAARESSVDMLRCVDMPDPLSVLDRYPHQLSGGMLQRAAIAMALITNPELLILDEPTTALDVTTQALVLDLVEDLRTRFNTAILYITHNLGVVARICDRVAVMYAGEIVEEADVVDLFEQPLHPYTINLLNCVPRFIGDGETESGPGRPAFSVPSSGTAGGVSSGRSPSSFIPRLAAIPGSLPPLSDLPPGCLFAPRCPLAVDDCRADRSQLRIARNRSTSCLRWESLLTESGRQAAIAPVQRAEITDAAIAPYGNGLGLPRGAARPAAGEDLLTVRNLSRSYPVRSRGREVRAVDGVTTWVDAARTLGLVGESGSGKTTLARVIGGLSAPSGGQVLLKGEALGPLTTDRRRQVLRSLQMVFQNPEASLNPRRTVGQAIVRPLVTLQNLSRDAAGDRAHYLLAAVRLPEDYFYRYPTELSGGEKQRVAIARAFAAAPDLVICDEPISSLDVSVQGSLMNLLVDLQEEQDTSYLFISHDVTAVQHLSHRIAVMYLGALVEHGEASRVLSPPYHPYTEVLLSAVPLPDPRAERTRVKLQGGPPPAGEIPSGCRFHPRCPRYLGEICATKEPPWLTAVGPAAGLGGKSVQTGAETEAGIADHATRCHIPHTELLRLQLANRLTSESPGASTDVGQPEGLDGATSVGGTDEAGP